MTPKRIVLVLLLAVGGTGLYGTPAAADAVCEARLTECRSGLIAYINREIIGLDIGMEEMADTRSPRISTPTR